MKLSQLVTSAFIRVLNKLWLAGFALVLSSSLNAQELSKLPYVPTPQIVVDEMLKLAVSRRKILSSISVPAMAG